MTMLVQKSISATQSFTMLAIPLFILAGNLMNATGITKRLMRLANVLTGHMYGNVGQVSCVLSTLMGGVSGSAVADAAMETRILGPEMSALASKRLGGGDQRPFGLDCCDDSAFHGSDYLWHGRRGFDWPSVHGRLGAGSSDDGAADAGDQLVCASLRL